MNAVHLITRFLIITTILGFALNPFGANGQSAIAPREKLSFDFGWRFLLGDIDEYTTDQDKGGKVGRKMDKYFDPGFNDSSWRPINLPHDFTVEQQFDKNAKSNGGLPDGIAWYRRKFKASPKEDGKRYLLSFDGIARFSEIFVNGFRVKTLRFGYGGCSIDITEALNTKTDNILMVRLNTLEGAEGWWAEGGGIYRHVWLEKMNPVHIPKYGVAIKPELDAAMSSGNVHAAVEIVNDGYNNKSVAAEISLKNRKGEIIGKVKSEAIEILAGKKITVTLNININNPETWTPENPVLYTVESILMADGFQIDGMANTIGFTNFKFDVKKGFLVNGKKEILKGVCMHQDHAGVGIAVPDELLRYRLQKLKALGINAYRSHHPNAPEVAQICNELGIFLLAETRHFSPFSDSKEMLEELVLMERNNPCVIAWSLGNEEYIVGEERSAEVVKKMRHIIYGLDLQKRPVTLASNRSPNGPAAKEVDVVGVNYHTSWLVSKSNEHNHPKFSSESGSVVSTRGEYENDSARRVVSSYDRKAVNWGQSGEELMDFTMNLPEIGGTFYWTGFDYRGEPTPYNWPNVVSNFGLYDLCGFRKDLSYLFEAWWGKHDVLHIFPHWNWEHAGKDSIAVWVYSNYDEVELLLNNKSLGKQKMPQYKHLEWKVKYRPGTLVAKGYRKGKVVAQTIVKTAGAPENIQIETQKETVVADEQDLIVFDISITDAQGNSNPNADNLLKFSLSGPGRMLGVGNGNPLSHEPDKLPLRKAFHGKVQVIVQTTQEHGDIILTVTSDSLKTKTFTIKSIAPGIRKPRVPSDVKEVELMKFYPKSNMLKGKEKKSKGAQTIEEMYKETAGYSLENDTEK